MDENLPSFSIYGKESFLLIKNNKSANVKDFYLQININDLTMSLIESKDKLGKKLSDCEGVIGIIILEQETYLIVITKASLVCTISKKEIYKVLDTNFIKLTENFEDVEIKSEEKEEKKENKENKDLDLINQLKEKFKNGFYYSNGYDLANSLTSQNQIQNYFTKEKKLISDYDYIDEGNKNFLANFKLTSQLVPLKKKQNIKYFFSNCI